MCPKYTQLLPPFETLALPPKFMIIDMMQIRPHRSGCLCTCPGSANTGIRCRGSGKRSAVQISCRKDWVIEVVLLDECQRELNHSAQEISEVLVEKEWLNSWEEGEGEAFEDLFEPHFVAGPTIDMSHTNYNTQHFKQCTRWSPFH